MAAPRVVAAHGPAWLEVALNGAWDRRRQPLVPISVAEIVADGIACARAGAAILHYHAFDPATGRQSDDVDLHRRIIEGIRGQADVLVYPTTSSRKLRPGQPDLLTGRFDLAQALAGLGLLDCLVIDPGAHLMFDPLGRWPAYIYANYSEDIDAALALCRDCGAAPTFAIYEPGYARLGALRAAAAGLRSAPLYRAMFSDSLLYGLPPGQPAIDAYACLYQGLGTRWMMAGLDFDIQPWMAPALAAGADIRVGLEDAPHGSTLGNLAQVQQAVQVIQASGRGLASAAQIRQALARVPQAPLET